MRYVTKTQLMERATEIISLFTTEKPEIWMVESYYNNESNSIQDFVVNHLKEEFQYATAYEILESAIHIAESQIHNGLETLYTLEGSFYECINGEIKKR